MAAIAHQDGDVPTTTWPGTAYIVLTERDPRRLGAGEDQLVTGGTVVLGGLAVAGLLIRPLLGSATFEQMGPLRSAAGLVSYVALVVIFARLFAVPTSSAGSHWSRWPSLRARA